MLDEIKEFWTALETVPYGTTVVSVLLVIIAAFLVYRVFMKKDYKLKVAIIKVIQQNIADAKDKGITVDLVVDDIITKAEVRIKAKPDSYDNLLLYFLHAKWFRSKLISIIEKLIKEIEEENTSIENK